MRLRSLRACAGFRFERLSSSGIALLRLLHLHEVGDFSQHTRELRCVLVLGRAADLPQTERAQRAAMALRLADLAAGLGDAKLAHGASVRGTPGPSSGSDSVPASDSLDSPLSALSRGTASSASGAAAGSPAASGSFCVAAVSPVDSGPTVAVTLSVGPSVSVGSA